MKWKISKLGNLWDLQPLKNKRLNWYAHGWKLKDKQKLKMEKLMDDLNRDYWWMVYAGIEEPGEKIHIMPTSKYWEKLNESRKSVQVNYGQNITTANGCTKY